MLVKGATGLLTIIIHDHAAKTHKNNDPLNYEADDIYYCQLMTCSVGNAQAKYRNHQFSATTLSYATSRDKFFYDILFR